MMMMMIVRQKKRQIVHLRMSDETVYKCIYTTNYVCSFFLNVLLNSSNSSCCHGLVLSDYNRHGVKTMIVRTRIELNEAWKMAIY